MRWNIIEAQLEHVIDQSQTVFPNCTKHQIVPSKWLWIVLLLELTTSHSNKTTASFTSLKSQDTLPVSESKETISHSIAELGAVSKEEMLIWPEMESGRFELFCEPHRLLWSTGVSFFTLRLFSSAIGIWSRMVSLNNGIEFEFLILVRCEYLSIISVLSVRLNFRRGRYSTVTALSTLILSQILSYARRDELSCSYSLLTMLHTQFQHQSLTLLHKKSKVYQSMPEVMCFLQKWIAPLCSCFTVLFIFDALSIRITIL